MHLAEHMFPPASESVSTARRFVTETLESWRADGLVWSAQQVVSELATNAVLHAATAFTVVLSLDGDLLRVEVRDQSGRAPRQRHYSEEATTGRGLALVASIARAWGVSHASVGKSIWCELEAHAPDAAVVDLDAFLSEEDATELGEQSSGTDRSSGDARAALGRAA